DILVRADGIIEVTETIKVRAENNQIRRGIYRDYPTRYKDRFGNAVVVDYEPLSVTRDGRSEPFRSEAYSNGVRTYFGSADVMLTPDVYTYVYRYNAGRMLGFFEERDELYWNVTGLGWDFPIDSASASVRFDFSIDAADLGVDAWTGRQGERGKAYTATTQQGEAQFRTTEALGNRAGLTIFVNWPKGLVAEPSDWQRFQWLLQDNRALLFALGGLLLMLVYYLTVWSRYGRDPAPGVTFTRYEPPAGFSPASLRFIRKMGYDSKAFTAAIVNLAVKGWLLIEQTGKKYTLIRSAPGKGASELMKGERELFDALFGEHLSVELDNENHKILSAARSAHRRSLRAEYRQRYFQTNGAMNLPAAIIFIVTLLLTFGTGSPTPVSIAVVIAMVITMALFAYLMKRPTGIGRRVLDETDGFREYLEIAEKDELNLRNPPKKTPHLFEAYLPYALALGVEQQWAERFTKVFESLRGLDGRPYQPTWYNGAWNNLNLSSATSSISSGLNSAISSSMNAPGSSSGGGGGGFSGGGGGGGGGGGW
ncbi:MAG: DUF2207 domain-containing protein, partial [Woeseia sp.]